MNKTQLANYFDHTFLKPYATEADLTKLCNEAKEIGAAMVAINTTWTKFCKEQLKGTSVHVGAAISFPLGQAGLASKVAETKIAIEDGADEIDYVIDIGQAKMHHWDYIKEEMESIVSICREHNVISKVIFENCYLEKDEIKHDLAHCRDNDIAAGQDDENGQTHTHAVEERGRDRHGGAHAYLLDKNGVIGNEAFSKLFLDIHSVPP